jgi:hypothetical protein
MSGTKFGTAFWTDEALKGAKSKSSSFEEVSVITDIKTMPSSVKNRDTLYSLAEQTISRCEDHLKTCEDEECLVGDILCVIKDLMAARRALGDTGPVASMLDVMIYGATSDRAKETVYLTLGIQHVDIITLMGPASLDAYRALVEERMRY